MRRWGRECDQVRRRGAPTVYLEPASGIQSEDHQSRLRGHEADAQSLTNLPGAVQRRVIPIRPKPARVWVSTIHLARTWSDLASHGDITAFGGPCYAAFKPARQQEISGDICRAPSCLPLTGRLVGSVDLPRLLPNVGNLLHREKARQLDVLYGTG